MTVDASAQNPAFLQLIADLVPDIIAKVDNNKIYTWLNTSGLEFFGDDAIGKSADSFFEGEQQTFATVQGLFDGQKDVVYVESWQRRKDGRKRLLAWWCKAVKDEAGTIEGAVSTAHDITERHETEEKLRYSERQLHNALALAHLGPWEYDAVKDLFTFNDTFYAMLKTTAEDVGGYTMSSRDYAARFVHPDDAQLVGIEVQKALQATDPKFTSQLQHRIVYPDRSIGYVIVRFFIVKDENRKTVKTFGINQDITDRKSEEEVLKTTQAQLQKKIKDLEAFNNLVIDRELKMVELKNEVDELQKKLAVFEKK